MSAAAPHALVLTAAPGTGHLTPGAIDGARAALDGTKLLDERWLSPGEAWEAIVQTAAGASPQALHTEVAARLTGQRVDVNLIAADPARRRARLLVSDMDSTIIAQECIDEMAAMLDLKPRIAAITERAMRGELDFEAALRERLALLAGLSHAQLERVFAERVTLMPGARTLVATMRANGAFTALVSGGFTFFTSRVAAAAGFEANHANELEFDTAGLAGRLTGRVVGPILGRDAKRRLLESYTTKLGLDATATLAAGDGANDLAMIRIAGLGVAYRAKAVVAAEAHAAIVHGDLTALLYLQGYAKSEFVER